MYGSWGIVSREEDSDSFHKIIRKRVRRRLCLSDCRWSSSKRRTRVLPHALNRKTKVQYQTHTQHTNWREKEIMFLEAKRTVPLLSYTHPYTKITCRLFVFSIIPQEWSSACACVCKIEAVVQDIHAKHTHAHGVLKYTSLAKIVAIENNNDEAVKRPTVFVESLYVLTL